MKAKKTKKRLDAVIVEQGLAASLAKAEAMILAGEVHVNGVLATKAGTRVSPEAQIEVASRAAKYASRAGFKLEGALADFGIDARGTICLDIGSSTGGFTDCLLQHGAARVYAVDVNLNQLSWKLRKDPRVIAIKQNARELRCKEIGEPPDIVVIDVSFISAIKVLQPATVCAKRGADLLILVKPQFELPREDIARGGIVTDISLHEKAVNHVTEAAINSGLKILGTRRSRLPGAEGNQEYFVHARKSL